MGRLIVIQFITLDGVVEDPDGSDDTEFGGWAMRHGPQGVAGDKFRLGPILEHGTLLFGRRTWEHFSTLWPTRDDPFSRAMNAATKAVATHHDINLDVWANSRAVDKPLTLWVRDTLPTTDVVVIGSGSIVEALAREELVDEYRLLVFPTSAGSGRRLFPAGQHLELGSVEHVGPAALCVLTPVGRHAIE
jgi:dihydrofolate reductase